MKRAVTSIRFFLNSEDGPTAVEYAVLLASILLVVIGTVVQLGSTSGGMWSNSQQQMEAVGIK